MIITAHCCRTLHVLTLSLLLVTQPAWAQHSYQDAEDTAALTEQDADEDTEDQGQLFEQETTDIEQQYSDLIPESAKSDAGKEMMNNRQSREAAGGPGEREY